MSKNKEVLATATVKLKYEGTEIETGEFKLNALTNQLKDNDCEFIIVGGVVVPKVNIIAIKVNEIEDDEEENIMNTYQGQYETEINNAAIKYGVDPCLIAGMIKTESNFNPIAISLAGAKGLMQLMKGTCEEVNVSDPFDPEQNINGGVKWFSERLKEFGDVQKALAAYNCGTKTVMKYDGIPPFKETQEYVQKVLANYVSFSLAYNN